MPLCCFLRVGADITVLREREVDYDSEEPRKIAEVLIRKVPDDQQVSPHSIYRIKHNSDLYTCGLVSVMLCDVFK